MIILSNWLKARLSEEDGATMVEYALIAALISIAAIAIMPTLGAKILATFTTINNAIP